MNSENPQAREIDGEDTPVVRQVARRDATVVDFGAPPAHRQTQTQPCPVRTTLFERPEQVVNLSVGKAATLVFDFDQDAVGGRAAAQRHGGPGPREFEGILKQVCHDRGQYWPVSVHACPRVPTLHAERESVRVRLQRRRGCQFRDEFGDVELAAISELDDRWCRKVSTS